MKIATLYFFLFGLLMLIGCSGKNEESQRNNAFHYSTAAKEQIAKGDFTGAEQSLNRSIQLYSSFNDKSKLVEQYLFLASVQISLGKLSSALSSYSSVKDIYDQSTDWNSEIPVMIEMERLSYRLGHPDKAQEFLEKALLGSQLYRLSHLHSVILLQLGRLLENENKPQQANGIFNLAAKEFLNANDTANYISASAGKIATLLLLGNRGEAKRLYAGIETILERNKSSEYAASAVNTIADAFYRSHEWSTAKALYSDVLAMPERQDTLNGKSAISAHIGIGNIFFKNYDYSDALKHYLAAYKLAHRQSRSLFEGYSLVRIADCQVKQYTTQGSPDMLLRSLQFYEHAQSIFSRLHLGIGEAIVLHRIGMLKQVSADDNAAIAYYKQAVEKYSTNDIDIKYLELPVDLIDLCSTSVASDSPVHWLTKNLITLLLKYRRSKEAYSYVLYAESYGVRRVVETHSIVFSDNEKQKNYSATTGLRDHIKQLLIESYYAAEVDNKSFADDLEDQLSVERERSRTAMAETGKRYPELAFLYRQLSQEDSVEQFLDPASTLIRFYSANDDCWAFVLQNGSDPVSIKLSSSGMALKETMKRLIRDLGEKNYTEYTRLAEKLYGILIKPIEQFGKQRFIFVPIQGLEKFPFHALTRHGRPLIDMIEVSYMPSEDLLRAKKPFPRFINNTIAVGFTTDPRWGLEFELRDIRSFFPNTQVLVNQSATGDNLTKTFGEVLQLSTLFQTSTDGDMTYLLSDGAPSSVGMQIPVSSFTAMYRFPLVYLEDVQSDANNIRARHSLYWLMNGSSAVITTEYPTNTKMSKKFREAFYSTLSASPYPYSAYRSAVRAVIEQKQNSQMNNWPSFFYYGW